MFPRTNIPWVPCDMCFPVRETQNTDAMKTSFERLEINMVTTLSILLAFILKV